MISYGFCRLGIVPLRAEASDKSEMVSQLLFGDTFKILQKETKWMKVCLLYDNYEGWVDIKQIVEISTLELEKINRWKNFSKALHSTLFCNGQLMPIIKGTALPLEQNFVIGESSYSYNPQEIPFENQERSLLEIAFDYLGSPYLWGGRSPFGIDCSGFVQMVFKMKQTFLFRDAWQQAQQGTVVNSFSEVQANDLAFFDNAEGKIIHVGICCGKGKIIHASGLVRVDKLDERGIFNTETNEYSHKLRLIRRTIITDEF